MTNIINIILIVVSCLLIVAVLLQSRGGGLSNIFGGAGEVYQTRRGIEKTIFVITIILVVLFLGLGIARLIIK